MIGNIGEAWSRGQLGVALLNSTYVTAMTVAVVLALSVMGAFALTRLRPPLRGVLFLLVLAPLIVPTEVLIVPLFSMFRSLGLINSLPGLAVFNVVGSVSFATVILTGYFRTIPQDLIDAARIDGAGRMVVLLRVVVPLARPGIIAVALLVAVLTWNDFAGALVLIQNPDEFTVQLALSRFSTFYATDPGPHLRRFGDRDRPATIPLRGTPTQLHLRADRWRRSPLKGRRRRPLAYLARHSSTEHQGGHIPQRSPGHVGRSRKIRRTRSEREMVVCAG